MIYLVVLLVLVGYPGQGNSLQCRVCKNVAGLEDCTESETCSPNSVCFTDEKIVGNEVLYESGCRSLSVCQATGRRSLSKRDDGALIACSRCCNLNETVTPLGKKHCNEYLCGLRLSGSLAGLHQCYTCSGVRDINACNTITTCQQDKVCIVEEGYDVNNFTTYTMGCSKTPQCILATRFRVENEALFNQGAIVTGKRNVVTACSACCGGSLCNTGGCFKLVDKLRKLWKAGSLDISTLTYVQPTNG
ncbi:uncharacterized protein LOC123560123 [Mercenaria mercenaria]|uniref:uncharacterized protein LOC123560123 n=1 Tax=Mercenaria mercenaria TaxID=6596 RepID=UPI001E1DA73E|nr:uncharacterized protein LOC123560123 [Mercenaria mercenaria]